MGARPGLAAVCLAAAACGGLALRTPISRRDVDVSPALSCLWRTTPSLALRYPEDAEEHVEEILAPMWEFQPTSPYVGNRSKFNYHLEHQWMKLYLHWKEQKKSGARLSDVFGPYVPIFTHWVEPWVYQKPNGRQIYPVGFVDALKRVLRKDVPYITASASASGLVGKPRDNISLGEMPNVLVLSAGGYGHVPVPLWKEVMPNYSYFAPRLPRGPRAFPRRYFMSYLGSLIHAPGGMRKEMKGVVERYADEHGMSVADEIDNATWEEALLNQKRHGRRNSTPPEPGRKPSSEFLFFYRRAGDIKEMWQEAMVDSRFSLTPRGYGRTSYHLAEILLLGLVPIHVYTDMPWIPYRRLYDRFGFVTTVDGLPKLLDELRLMGDEELLAREAAAREHVESHYLEEGFRDQLLRFMTGRDSAGRQDAGDLECVPLPPTVRARLPNDPP